uniref:NADH-ubiquinone oxidoreductase chain 4 n=1 Tax=Rhinotergum shaoguanense TaxID=1452699 RepID=A0A1S5XVW9_9ACAR|nr:NADH dehydrogenase subunit 4 [Rhinotergum shaoguanense]AQQ72853.1 NADH dehydrogenase subunit 4 [Rhinotergum shaoguanense]
MMWFFLFLSLCAISFKDWMFFSSMFFIDGFTVFIISIIPLVLIMILLFHFNYSSTDEMLIYYSSFFFILLFVFAVFLVNHSFLFIFFIEMCVYLMSFLILFYSKDLDKYASTLFMFTLNILGSIPFLLFSTLLTDTSFTFSLFNQVFSLSYVSNMIMFFSFFLILVSKLPLMFFHFWLTKAHVSASGSCSMILASLMLKLGSFGFYKFFLFFFFCSLLTFNMTVSLSLFSCLFFCLLMLRFSDMKHLIACSSILHMSLIFPLTGSGFTPGIFSSMFMMVGHGLVSYFLFFLVTLLYEFSYGRSMDLNKSQESFTKSILMMLFIFLFLNIGFPPFLNFYSEVGFCLFLLSFSLISLIIFCLTMTFSILFTMYLISKSIFGKKHSFFLLENDGTVNFFSLKLLYSLLVLSFIT